MLAKTMLSNMFVAAWRCSALFAYIVYLVVASNKTKYTPRHELELIRSKDNHFLLDGMVVGKSTTLDYRGNPYYFFVFQKRMDTYVSGDMLKSGACVEINFLY